MSDHTMEEKRVEAEIAQLMANTMKLQAETSKLINESEKIHKELRWYEVTIIIALTLAVVAVAKLFL